VHQRIYDGVAARLAPEQATVLETLLVKLRIPRDGGRGFHGIVGVNSTGRWAGIPRDRGHLGSGA